MSRWVIHAQASFDARHALTFYRGKAESSHGHPWKIAVRVGADALNEESYALDFHQVRDLLAAAIAPLDRSDLNDHPDIGRHSPTTRRSAGGCWSSACGKGPTIASILSSTPTGFRTRVLKSHQTCSRP